MINTTTIGSYPKPDYLDIPDWVKNKTFGFMSAYTGHLKNRDQMAEYKIMKALKEYSELQEEVGLDILTDGELRRGDYITYHCCHLHGIDSENLKEKVCRNGAYSWMSPVINEKITAGAPFLAGEAKTLSLFTDKPIKMQIPGPFTIRDTILDEFYMKNVDGKVVDDIEGYQTDMALAMNAEVLDMAKNGLKYVQIDEPVFARQPEKAIQHGIKYLDTVFQGIEDYDLKTIVHICCGYPDALNNETDYKRADKDAYKMLVPELEKIKNLDFIALEDAHRYNDEELFSLFKTKGLVLGVINIANTRVETVDEIKERIRVALKYVSADKLMLSPDCGMILLPRDIAAQKLANMTKAAREMEVEIAQK